MNSKWIGLCLWIMVNTITVHSQDKKSRVNDWGVPHAGEMLKVDYTSEGGPLEGIKDIKGIIYLYNNYRWMVDDVNLTYKNKKWEGAYALPANCAFFAIKFVAEENGLVVAQDNNNDLGFLSTTLSKNNGKVPGASIAWGVFRKPSINKAPGGYFDKANIGDEALEMWVRKEMKDFPANVPKFFDVYLEMLKLSKPEEFDMLARRNLKKLAALPNLTEETYQIIINSYNFILKDKTTADSIKNIVLQKFPKGNMQRMAAMVKVNSEGNTAAGGEPALDFLKAFPIVDYRKDSVLTQNYIYYGMYRQIGTNFFAAAKYDALAPYIADMDFESVNEVYRWNITRTFLAKKVPLENVYPIAKIMIDAAIAKRSDGSFMQGTTYTPRQAAYLAGIQLDKRLSLHIRILHKINKDKEALEYMKYLSAEGKFADADVNEVRIAILQSTGNDRLILPALQESIKVNTATPAMLAQLKAIYAKKKGSDKGFDIYLESLKEKTLVAQDKKTIRAQMIKQRMDTFTLKDLEGTDVNTALLKDNIIVLDFWATWCYPCKMAFPGMQMLVDHYASDKTVNVFFISTMERKESYKEDIKKYMKTSGYRFDVLLDDEVPETGQNNRLFKTLTPIFNSSAIPRKVVIKNGLIRYTAEGYAGSPTKLFDELSYVIELLKAEK